MVEEIVSVPLSELHPFQNHPFKVLDDALMEDTVESIQNGGIRSPLIVRELESGGYEIISGHRRARAAGLAGLEQVPVIVRNMDDDAAVLCMVDSNLQRETILPSERAFAYKMKMDVMKRKTGRPSKENGGQVGHHLKTVDLIALNSSDSAKQIQRYIRLTNLIPEILDLVDEGQIKFNPAVELSYLDDGEQMDFLEAMEYAQTTPSLSQAQRIKKLSQAGACTLEAMCDIMDEVKKGELDHVKLKNEVLRKYFPKSYTPKQMEDTIIKLLEQWQKRRQRDQER